MNIAQPSLLVIGGHDSGKSTYRAQLCHRIEHAKGELQLVKSISDMTSLESDVGRLVQGLEIMHTNADVYHSTSLTVEDRLRRKLSIDFADYGGEQIGRIGKANTVPDSWVERAKNSASWLFFLRIDQVRPSKSFMTEPVQAELRTEVIEEPFSDTLPLQLEAVEVLQRLLFARGTSFRHRLSSPQLGIFLSCWDELAASEQEQGVQAILEQRAPLFYRFISSNWQTGCFKFWALSSTEQKLPKLEADRDFARIGPDKKGYVIDEMGVKTTDLTVPVSWLMQPE